VATVTRPKPRRLRHPVSRIKTGCTYDVGDIAKLLDVHKNTVRNWLKQGLTTIDTRRPLLVHGATLKVFLQARQGARRRVCRLGEFYCFKCREPRGAWGGMADVRAYTDKIAKVIALCRDCGTEMHRSIRRADLGKLALVLELKPMASTRINELPAAIENCDFEKDRRYVEIEPAE